MCSVGRVGRWGDVAGETGSLSRANDDLTTETVMVCTCVWPARSVMNWSD